jgi:hypothetical protein
MGSKAFPLLGLLLAAIVLLIISSEVAARDLAQTSFYQKDGTYRCSVLLISTRAVFVLRERNNGKWCHILFHELKIIAFPYK